MEGYDLAMKNICVFTGAAMGNREIYGETAFELGRLIAKHGMGLVYGGGRNGLMGRVADGALDAGGRVTGIIPKFLDSVEIAHKGVTDLRITDSMHERKEMMYGMSDAFIVLPGGLGTLDEAMEVITWSQLQLHDKTVVILDIEDYWKHMLSMLKHVIDEGFMHDDHIEHFATASSLDDIDARFERMLED